MESATTQRQTLPRAQPAIPLAAEIPHAEAPVLAQRLSLRANYPDAITTESLPTERAATSSISRRFQSETSAAIVDRHVQTVGRFGLTDDYKDETVELVR